MIDRFGPVLSVAVTAVVAWAGPALAAPIDHNTNLAATGNGLMGYAASATTGVAYSQKNRLHQLNDGDLAGNNYDTTHIPDYNSQDPDDQWVYDYVGVSWATSQSGVAEIQLYIKKFGDGGWFATGGTGANDPTADSLSYAPTVQYSTDGGASWLVAANQSTDYDAATAYAPATFAFDPLSGINAIRVIGDGWGPSGSDPTGFLGVTEIEVYAVPEPASLTLLALGAAAMWPRRREQRGHTGRIR